MKINSELNNRNEELSSRLSRIETATFDSTISNKQLVILNQKMLETFERSENISKDSNIHTSEVIKKEILILKEIKQVNESQVSNFIQDIEKINKVQHPNIVRILGIAKNDQKTPFTILTERCDIDLYQAISTKKFSKIDSSLVIYEIAEGMKFIHSIQIINTNLNPYNILIGKDGRIKISDIGLNKIKTLENQQLPINSNIASLYFMAPEILNNGPCSEKVDVYSFGVLAYFIIKGELPNIEFSELIKGIPLQIPSTFSPNAKEIIEYCCNINPQARPSFNEIVDYLKNDQCALVDLSKSELQEVHHRIGEHQKLIPKY